MQEDILIFSLLVRGKPGLGNATNNDLRLKFLEIMKLWFSSIKYLLKLKSILTDENPRPCIMRSV